MLAFRVEDRPDRPVGLLGVTVYPGMDLASVHQQRVRPVAAAGPHAWGEDPVSHQRDLGLDLPPAPAGLNRWRPLAQSQPRAGVQATGSTM